MVLKAHPKNPEKKLKSIMCTQNCDWTLSLGGKCRFSILWATWYFCWGKIGVFIPGVFIPGVFIPRVLQRYLFRGYLFQGYLFRRYLFLGCFFLGCLFLGCFFQGCFFLGYLFRGIYSWGIYSGHREEASSTTVVCL